MPEQICDPDLSETGNSSDREQRDGATDDSRWSREELWFGSKIGMTKRRWKRRAPYRFYQPRTRVLVVLSGALTAPVSSMELRTCAERDTLVVVVRASCEDDIANLLDVLPYREPSGGKLGIGGSR
jgi:hypothetical protein